MNYKKKIILEGKAFDKQVLQRKKYGLVPDLRNLKKNFNFYNNPWREPEFFKIQWMEIVQNIIKECNNDNKPKKILEAGCGTGFLSLELAREGHEVLGVDISKQSIKEANDYLLKVKKKEEVKLEFKSADINNLKLTKKYDVLVFYRSLHHFKNTSKLLKKLDKSLNKNSTLIICEPLRKNYKRLNSIFSMLLRLSLETWVSYEKKIPKKINNNFFKHYENQINSEYIYKNYKKKFVQSPMDNSTDDPNEVIKSVKKYYKIKKIKYYDSFIDKIIGGLRGKNRFIIAQLLKKFDNYLIEENILKGTTLYLTAKKK